MERERESESKEQSSIKSNRIERAEIKICSS